MSCVSGACDALVGCPVAYSGCPLYLGSGTPLTALNVCSPNELLKLRTACAGASTPPGCSQAIVTLSQNNPACGSCIDQFTDQGALVLCLAPYLTQPCIHALSCSLDCMSAACVQCSGAEATQCQNDVFKGGETCSSYQEGLTCYESAIAGQASFCAFDGDYGAWIGAVGNHYCGTGVL